MIKDITIGQYYAVDSPVHRLDPRVKLAATILYIISLFVADGPICYLFAALFLISVIRIAHIPLKFMTRGLKGIILLLLLSVSFNLFLTPGQPLIQIGFLKITIEGLELAAYMAVRLILLILGSSLMTLTTTPNSLTDGLEKSLGFLKKIHIPVHEIAMMMSIALRFIPILIEETDKIMKAQTARGADFENKSIIKRAKAMVPILIPLFISAFRRASDLAMAMEARCYRGDVNRTKMKPLKYTGRDGKAYILMFAYLALMIAMAVLYRKFF